MIKKIYSDLSTFKTVELKTGLNILLSQKTPSASEKQTRNRAGKTSFIELIHFLMGSKSSTGSLLRTPELNDYTFGISFDFGTGTTEVERSGSSHGRVVVATGDTSKWVIQPLLDKKTGDRYLSNSNWCTVLGGLLFNLATNEDDDSASSGPTFRSVFPYFARRQNAGGFIEPQRQSEDQQHGNWQIAISYLLGLDWTLPASWQAIRDSERTLRELKKAAGSSAFGAMLGSIASLRTRLTVAEQRTVELRKAVTTFKVLPEYEIVEKEISDISQLLSKFANEDTIDVHLLSELNQASKEERPPESADLERVYREAGLVFKDTTLKRFEEVKMFHESVVKNRKAYLQDEVRQIEVRISKRKVEMTKLDHRRSELMSILSSGGALEQYNKFQSELTKKEAEFEALKKQYELTEILESKKTELSVERGKLYHQLQQEYQESQETLKKAILSFEEISSQLYEKAGSFTISESANGPEFRVDIQGSRSKGISNMQIFCFDLMLMKLCKERGVGPTFLIHDSHIFDGVDIRQVAKAIMIGGSYATKFGFQYIITLNSDVYDAVQSELGSTFDIKANLIKPTLSDESDSGGLFGFRFD